MFAALARFTIRYRWPVLIVFLILFPVAGVFGGGLFSSLAGGGFDDPTAESFKAEQRISDRLGASRADVVALYTVSSGTVDDPATSASLAAAVRRVAADPAVERVAAFATTGSPQFISRDRTRAFAVITFRDAATDAAEVERLRPLLAAGGATLSLGGLIPVDEEIGSQVESGLQRAELIAFPITAVLLVVIFGSLVSAAVPLLLGGFAIMLAFATLRIITAFTDVSQFAANIVTVLGLGLAIDYSLFILNRYREELPERGVEGALITAISTTGRAVAFSGITVAASLVGLFVFPRMFLRSMALGGIAVTLGAVVLAITLLPALIAVLGPRIDALRVPRLGRAPVRERAAIENGFWHRVAVAVMRRPVLVAVAVVAVLLVAGSPFLRFHASTPDVRVLGAEVEARTVSDLIDREFLPHQTTPHQVALTGRDSVLTPDAIGALYDYTRRVAELPGVTRVDSIFSLAPGLDRAAYQSLYSRSASEQDAGLAAGLATFGRDNFTRLAVVSAGESDAAVTQAQVKALRALPPPTGMDVLVGGAAAGLTDLKDGIRARAPLMIAVITAVMLVVLFLVFGSVTLPLKALAMNLLSLTASYGALVWIFQDGRLEGLLRYESLGSVDATQPILMFAIVFGLSMDYEVLLLSRMREEYRRTGDNALAVAHGLEKTGRLITSAAALLVVVIGAFATSDIIFMKQLGVGMALAIAIDATIVRALLVPATMRLMGRWNWWAPAPLGRLWQRIGLGDLEGHGPVSAPAAAGAGQPRLHKRRDPL